MTNQTLRAFKLHDICSVQAPEDGADRLFWVLPIAPWSEEALRQLAAAFANIPRGAALFPPETGRASRAKNYASLEEAMRFFNVVSAGKLLPEAHAWRGGALIISPAYPNPGWGVLLRPTSEDKCGVDELVALIQGGEIYGMNDGLSGYILHEEARKTHERLEQARKKLNELPAEDPAQVGLQAVLDALAEISNAVEAPDHRDAYAAIRKADACLRRVPEPVMLSIRVLSTAVEWRWIDLFAKFDKGAQVADRSVQGLLTALNPTLDERGRLVDSEWRAAQKGVRMQGLVVLVTRLRSEVESALGPAVAAAANAKRARAGALADWKQARKANAEAWGAMMREFVKTSPNVLYSVGWVLLLRNNPRRGVRSDVIAWDPACAVGWQLCLSNDNMVTSARKDPMPAASEHAVDWDSQRDQGRLSRYDLKAALRDVLPGAAGAELDASLFDLSEQDEQVRCDGPLFADYARHVALLRPEKSLFEGAVELAVAMFGAGRLRRVAWECGLVGSEDPIPTAAVAQKLFLWLGWRIPPKEPRHPLCEYVELSSASAAERSDIRVAAESLVKDVVLAVAAELPNGLEEAEDIVRHDPLIEIRRGFREELRTLTIGTAIVWFRALLDSARYDEHRKVWIDALRELNELCKTHDNDAYYDESNFVAKAPAAVRRVVEACTALLGSSSPWHLRPERSSGRPPTVSGEAWSHTNGRKTIHVVLFEGIDDDEVLVWNPSGVNPVMTQAKILDHRVLTGP